MSDAKITRLRKEKNLMILGAGLVGVSTYLKVAGVWTTGFFPHWASGLLIAFCIGGAVHASWKIRKLGG